MNLLQRAKAPTPKFFKSLRTAGLTIAAIGAAIITSPVPLPAMLVTIAGYMTVAGGVLTAVSQVTTQGE